MARTKADNARKKNIDACKQTGRAKVDAKSKDSKPKGKALAVPQTVGKPASEHPAMQRESNSASSSTSPADATPSRAAPAHAAERVNTDSPVHAAERSKKDFMLMLKDAPAEMKAAYREISSNNDNGDKQVD